MSVQLIIDSACDLTVETANALGVILVPMTIQFQEETFRSGLDLTNEEFYGRLEQAVILPTTSQPAPYDFETIYENVHRNNDQAVVICMSSKLSGTYQSALIAAAEYPDSVFVVDSLSVTVGERILLDYAIRLRDQGYSAKEIRDQLEQAKHRIRIFGIVHSLDYLVKGGRLSKAAGAAGTLLGIRPVLSIRDGVLGVVAKARGPKAAYQMMNRLISQEQMDTTMPKAISHTGNTSDDLSAYLSAGGHCWTNSDVSDHIIGSTIGTHAGPHLIAGAFFVKT